MKKLNYLLVGTLAAASLASCSNDEVMEVQQGQQALLTTQSIAFSPLSKGANTRSQVFHSTSDLTDFRVLALWGESVNDSSTIWIKGQPKQSSTALGEAGRREANKVYLDFATDGIQEVVKSNSGWNFRDGVTRYWPYTATWGTDGKPSAYNCVKLRFKAYTPSSLNTIYAGLETAFFTGTADQFWTFEPAAAPKVSEMQDICLVDATADNENGAVALEFKHIFSQIVFKAKKTSLYEVDIKDIEIGGMKFKSRLAVDKYAEQSTWAGDANTNKPWGNATYYPGFASGTAITLTSAADAANVQLTEKGQELLIIPQAMDAWVPANGAVKTNDVPTGGYLKVTFRYRLAGSSAWITGEGAADGYETSYFPLKATWKKGKLYSYTLLFGGATNDEEGDKEDPQDDNPDPNPGGYDEDGSPKAPSVAITFSPTVTDWVNTAVDVKL